MSTIIWINDNGTPKRVMLHDNVTNVRHIKTVAHVRGYWRKDPRTGKRVWVKEHNRHYTYAQPTPTTVGRETAGPNMIVNFTAYRSPGQTGIAHTGEETYDELYKFVKKIENDPDIKVLSYMPSQGAWDTGAEPSAILKVQGDYNKLRKYLSEAGKRWDQDAIIISRPNPQSERKSYYFNLQAPIDKGNREKIKKVLVKNGITGWTWMRGPNGERYLNIIHFPEWGTTMTPEKADLLRNDLAKIGVNSTWKAYGIDLDIMERPYQEE